MRAGVHPLSRAGIPGPWTSSVLVAIALGLGSLVRLFVRRPPALPPPLAPVGDPAPRRPFDSTLLALVDAALPADETGGPGAREAGALEVLAMATLTGPLRLPVEGYLAALALATDAAAIVARGRRFRRLGTEDRSRLFGRLLALLPGLYVPVLVASGLAFTGGVVSDRGLAWLGLPREADGFEPRLGDLDFEPRPATRDGNLP